MFAEDLGVMFTDTGVTAVFGGVTAAVLLDVESQEIFDGMQQTDEFSITCRTADLPSVRTGDAGTVDGVAYKVRQVNLLDDGRLMKIELKR